MPIQETPENSPEKFFDEAYRLASNRRFFEAVEKLDKAIELNPNWITAIAHRAIHNFYSNRYSQAIEDIKKVHQMTELNPDNYAEDFWMMGESYIGLLKYDEAISSFNKSIEYDSDLSLAYSGRGYAYLKKGDLKLAIKDFNKAIELDSENGRAYLFRSEYWSTLGDNAKVILDQITQSTLPRPLN
jgi:tetratricopeptide (TPR) repeat protein